MKINSKEYGWNEIDETCYLYDSSTGTFYYINETGKKIWDIIQDLNKKGEHRKIVIYKEIIERLNREFSQINENINEDVNNFLQEMINIDAIIMENDDEYDEKTEINMHTV